MSDENLPPIEMMEDEELESYIYCAAERTREQIQDIAENAILITYKKMKRMTKQMASQCILKIFQLDAKERTNNKVLVFIGDLKAPSMRNKGAVSRRLSSYPRGELKERLVDRLQKDGVDVQLVNEYQTSVTCHACGSTNTKRIRQGLFICHDCKLRYNADANGAWNILGRGVRRRKSSKNKRLASSIPQILDKWVERALGALP